jgi:DNA repair exonuclease SbcCD ATPase subunit
MLPEEVRKAMESLPELTKKAAKTDELEAKLTETVTKLDTTTSELKKAQEDLAKAQEDQNKQKYITKAAGFKNLATTADELGLLMKAVAENKATPEDVTKLEGLLKAADEAIAKGSLFSEVGSSRGVVAGSALEKFNQMVDGLVQKDGKLTRADAIAKVARENPDLYNEYTNETTVMVKTKNKGQ